MHLSEGVLHLPVLAAGGIIAAAGVALGIKYLDNARLSLTALFGAAFFVAGTIHVPIGVSSVHLILNGMAGLFLGWAVFPAFLIALALQVLFFSFGGFAVLGVNLCNIAIPAMLVYFLFRNTLHPGMTNKRLVTLGIASGIIGVGGTVCLTSLALVLDSGKSYLDLVWLLFIGHLPIFVTDSIISVGVLLALAKMRPASFNIQHSAISH